MLSSNNRTRRATYQDTSLCVHTIVLGKSRPSENGFTPFYRRRDGDDGGPTRSVHDGSSCFIMSRKERSALRTHRYWRLLSHVCTISTILSYTVVGHDTPFTQTNGFGMGSYSLRFGLFRNDAKVVQCTIFSYM